MKISSGIKSRPQKVCINGPEGCGKTTLAADLDSPIFIDVEGGSDHMDVNRVEAGNMGEIREVFQFLKKDKHDFKTLVLDTIDWVEGKMIKEICAEHNTDSIVKVEGGYGKGFEILSEHMLEFLNQLDVVRREANMHIVLLAHTKIQRHEDPELAASYDRYTLKMEKKTSALVKEWVDALLFMNYDTKLADQKGTMEKKRGVQGKDRILHTARTAAFDAKNRHNLPDSIKVPPVDPAAGLSVLFEFGAETGSVVDKVLKDCGVKETKTKGHVPKGTPLDQEEDADEIPGLEESGTVSAIDKIVEDAGGIDAVKAFCKSKGVTWDQGMEEKALAKPDRFITAVRKEVAA